MAYQNSCYILNAREQWIDSLKGLAILGVLLDHTYRSLYNNAFIWHLSYFAVPLFCIVAGYNCYSSIQRHPEETLGLYLRRSLKTIWISYVVCVLIYRIVSLRMFDISDYIKMLVTFKASTPHYYVFLYSMLIFAGFFVFRVLRGINRWKQEAVLVIIILLFSMISTKYTNIFGFFGGAGKLFGGMYILMFTLGGFMYKHLRLNALSTRWMIMLALFFIPITIIMSYVITLYGTNLDSQAFDLGLSAPGISFSGNIVGLLSFVGFGSAILVCEENKVLSYVSKTLSFVGRYSLPIFLYHSFIIIYCVGEYNFSSIWIKRVVYYGGMIGGSIVVHYILRCLKGYFTQAIKRS